jgi:mannitol/fructose-specific phosphotransferase system IIA component
LDKIEYFKLAVPHAVKDEKVAILKAGVRCQQCHMPKAMGNNAKMANEDFSAQHL